jgi:hypothetical protein
VTDNNHDGVFDLLDTGIPALIVVNAPDPQVPQLNLEDRGLVEFSLAAVPDGAVLTSASLVFETIFYRSNTGTISIAGYVGDGVLAVSDATIAAVPLASYDGGALGLGIHSVSLALPLVQMLADSDGILGLQISGEFNMAGTQLASAEGAATFGDQRPQLELTFVPEPGGVRLALVGATMMLVAAARAKSFSAPVLSGS